MTTGTGVVCKTTGGPRVSNVGGGGGVGVEVWVMRVWVMGVSNKGRKGRKEAPLYWRVCVCLYYE